MVTVSRRKTDDIWEPSSITVSGTEKELEEIIDYIKHMYDKTTDDNDNNNNGNDAEVDMVNHPSHYCEHGMECIDEMVLVFGKEAVMNFCLCNCWKYRNRAPYKGNIEQDMEKSRWYLNKYKELKDSTASITYNPNVYRGNTIEINKVNDFPFNNKATC